MAPSRWRSHETALGVYGTSDANPSRVHVTVPKAARLTRRKPKWSVIHRATCRRRMSPLESHAIRRDGATRKLSRNRCEHKSVLSVAHDGTIQRIAPPLSCVHFVWEWNMLVNE